MSKSKEIKLFPYQLRILTSKKPLIVALCGRSVGKSFVSSWWAFKKALEVDGMGIIVAPTYQQAQIPIKYLMDILEQHNVSYCFNKSPKFALSNLPSHDNILSMLINGKLKQIKMASADTEDNLRSGSYSWAIVDECCFVSEDAINILLPTLRGQGTEFNYQVLLISSPAGKNHIYNNYIEPNIDSIEVIRAKSIENFYQVNEEKLSLWKETMSSRMYQQEIEAEILDSNLNAVIYAYNHKENSYVDKKQLPDKVIVSLDQNTDNASGVFIIKDKDNLFVFDEFRSDSGANYITYANEIKKRIPQNITIELCGDASGNARNVAAKDTFYNLLLVELRKSGYRIYDKTNKSNPSVYESREEINRLFERRKLHIHNSCKQLIKDIEQTCYKPGTFEIDKRKYDGHTLDALVYGIWNQRTTGMTFTKYS